MSTPLALPLALHVYTCSSMAIASIAIGIAIAMDAYVSDVAIGGGLQPE